VRTILGPVTRASAALQAKKPDEALAALEPAAQTELGTMAGLVPSYLRGQAFLQKGAPADAIREFQKLIDHRGVDPFAPTVPLAHLGLARAHAAAGDAAASRRAYEELFTIWKGADAAFAPLAEARAEYARLVRPTTVQ
jgi:predicted Zn-dependent protease